MERRWPRPKTGPLTRTDDVGVPVRDFVSASRDERDPEQAEIGGRSGSRVRSGSGARAGRASAPAETETRSRKRLRWLAIGLGIVSLVALVAGMLALSQTREAKRLAHLAEYARVSAQFERGVAQNHARRA